MMIVAKDPVCGPTEQARDWQGLLHTFKNNYENQTSLEEAGR